jgi:hypothetical protein
MDIFGSFPHMWPARDPVRVSESAFAEMLSGRPGILSDEWPRIASGRDKIRRRPGLSRDSAVRAIIAEMSILVSQREQTIDALK